MIFKILKLIVLLTSAQHKGDIQENKDNFRVANWRKYKRADSGRLKESFHPIHEDQRHN